MEPLTKIPSKKFLKGPKVGTAEDYGGLGVYFLTTLFQNLDKINQIDTVNAVTETCGSVRSRAIQVAQELRHLGIVENDIVIICSNGHTDQTIAVLACLLVGAIVAPIDSELRHQEWIVLVQQLKPKMCFCDLRALKRMERVVMETKITFKMIHFSSQQQYPIAFQKLLKHRPFENFRAVTVEHPRKRVAFILATQGTTTGTPRLVCLSHHFIFCQIGVMLKLMDLPENIISYYPLSYVLQVVIMCLCFAKPVVRVLTGEFVERSTCKLIQDLKIDYAFLHTEFALQLVEHVAVKDFNLQCLKTVFIGTLTTTSHDIKRLVFRLPGVRFVQLYCTTEVGIVVGCPPEEYKESLDRIGTVGKVVQNCALRVVDIEMREDIEVEARGELLIASDCMMLGYFKNMEFTKSCTQEGYFKTGDIARYDASGWIYIEGQLSDLINVRGFRELPRALEETILKHPYVKDTAVISDDEEVVACVIVKPDTKLDEEKLTAFIAERLPEKNWPTRILFMNDFPTTPLGKVKRDLLKEDVFSFKIEHSKSV